ncbi:MAG: TIGR00289 family protein [Methanobacteriota archaeon]
MRVACLFSGGKDSTLAHDVVRMWGWDVAALVTLVPRTGESWMFHVPNVHLTKLHAEALGLPLVSVTTSGEKERELDDLAAALSRLDVEGVVTGAVASEYQRVRVERVAHRLGLKVFSPLWHKSGEEIVARIVSGGYDVRIVGVFAEGLSREWLGRRVDAAFVEDVRRLRRRIHVAGEGGEYESLVLDGPFFSARIELVETETEWDGHRGTLGVRAARLAPRAAPVARKD